MNAVLFNGVKVFKTDMWIFYTILWHIVYIVKHLQPLMKYCILIEHNLKPSSNQHVYVPWKQFMLFWQDAY